MDSPLEQFAVKPLIPLEIFGYNISFTNSALMMLLAALSVCALMYCASFNLKIIPGKLQSIAEIMIGFVSDLVEENIVAEGQKYFAFIFTLFMFILFGNILGMIPFSFTFTSQLIVTFSLASLVFIVVVLIGIARHGVHFLKTFFPPGAPLWLAPILIPIELISFLSRPISLSIRLFANMMAGHTMMKVFALFTVLLGVWGISTVLLNILLIGFEFVVAFLQAYVFSVLTCLYIKDSLHLH